MGYAFRRRKCGRFSAGRDSGSRKSMRCIKNLHWKQFLWCSVDLQMRNMQFDPDDVTLVSQWVIQWDSIWRRGRIKSMFLILCFWSVCVTFGTSLNPSHTHSHSLQYSHSHIYVRPVTPEACSPYHQVVRDY